MANKSLELFALKPYGTFEVFLQNCEPVASVGAPTQLYVVRPWAPAEVDACVKDRYII
jgi:hypothetical protein